MKKFGLCFIVFIMSAGFILGSGASAFAQDNENDAFMLEEITVTAQKRSENQQDVAIAMDVITGDKMKELGQTGINQILNNVSSATVNKTGGFLRVSIRGLSEDNADGVVQNSAPTAAVNTDGVMTNRQQSGTGFYDLERVEVLIGPQSTLYASASPGGIVNVVTASPKLDKVEGSATLEIGSYNLVRGEGALNVPVGDTFALRGAFSTTSRDGYISNGGDDEDQKSGRLKALYQPNEKLSLALTGEVSRTEGHGFATVDEFNNQDDDYYPDGVTPLENPWSSTASTMGNEMKKDSYKIYAVLNYDFNPFSLTITPSYNESSSPSTSAGVSDRTGLYTTTVSNRENWEKSIEARLTSSEEFFFKWIFGAIYYEAYDASISDSVTSVSAEYNNKDNENTIKAVYGNVTYPLSEALRLTAGVRYSDDYNCTTEDQSDGPPDLVMPNSVIQKYKKPNYKFGVEYDLNERSMVYADVSNAYRTQGRGFDAYGNLYPAEQLMAYNLGAKNRFWGNRLQVNAAAYYYIYENKFGTNSANYLYLKNDVNGNGVYDEGDTIGSSPDGNAKAVGDYEQYGLDLDTSLLFTDKDRLDLNISFTHSEYSDLLFDYRYETNHPEDILAGAIGVPDMSYDGKPQTNSPSVSMTGSYTHNFNLPNGGTLTPRIDARYKSSYILTFSELSRSYDLTTMPPTYVETDLTGLREQEAYYTADFSTTYASPDGKWILTGYVKNMTDYAVKTSWTFMGAGGMMMIDAPRTYGAVLSVKF